MQLSPARLDDQIARYPCPGQDADDQAVADEFGDPAHRLEFYLGGGGRQPPTADIGIDGGSKKIAEDADR